MEKKERKKNGNVREDEGKRWISEQTVVRTGETGKRKLLRMREMDSGGMTEGIRTETRGDDLKWKKRQEARMDGRQ